MHMQSCLWCVPFTPEELVHFSTQTSPQESSNMYKAHVPGAGAQVQAVGLWDNPWKEEDRAFPCQTQPIPATSSGPTGDTQPVSRRAKCCLAVERKVKKCEKISPADTKVRAERRAGGASAQIPLQPVMQTMVKQVVPLHSMEIHSEPEINL